MLGRQRRLAALLAVICMLATIAVGTVPRAANVAAQERPDGRVLGGKPVPEGKYPFLVYVGKVGCTGTLITVRWVLTAAHCVVLNDGGVRPASEFRLTLFSVNWRDGNDRRVTKVVPHPNYNKTGRLENDVALLRLEQPVDKGDTVRFVRAGNTRFDKAGQKVTMTGWGATDPAEDQYPDRARQADSEIIKRDRCDEAYRDAGFGSVSDQMICIGKLPTICAGDSGGPLLVDTKTGWVQIGVVSYGGVPCGSLPSAYGRLSNEPIAKFIDRVISPPAKS